MVKSPKDDERGLKKASECLLAGGVIVYPTETYYGLGALALDERAVARVFEQKRRSVEKQLTVLIPDIETLGQFVVELPPLGKMLAEKFWPGPLTIILRASPDLLKPLKAVTEKVGFRVSSHPVALELTRLVNGPITATSANISGSPPVVDPRDLPGEFLKGVDLVLDSGKTPGGAASTIVDVTGAVPVILREGPLGVKVGKVIKLFS